MDLGLNMFFMISQKLSRNAIKTKSINNLDCYLSVIDVFNILHSNSKLLTANSFLGEVIIKYLTETYRIVILMMMKYGDKLLCLKFIHNSKNLDMSDQ